MGKLMVITICDVQVDRYSDGGVLQLPWSHTWDRTGTLQWHTCAFNVAPRHPLCPLSYLILVDTLKRSFLSSSCPATPPRPLPPLAP